MIGSSRLPSPVFIGVAPTAQVSKYLSGVARDRITSIDLSAGSVHYEHVNGTALPAPPGEQSFWVATAAGTGSQTLEWALQEGDWALVVMNGDASAPIAADVTLGARFGIVYPLVVGLTVAGVVLLAIGVALMRFGSRPRRMALEPPHGSPSRLLKKDVSPLERDGYAQRQGRKGEVRPSSAIHATENAVLCRPVRPGGPDFVLQRLPSAEEEPLFARRRLSGDRKVTIGEEQWQPVTCSTRKWFCR